MTFYLLFLFLATVILLVCKYYNRNNEALIALFFLALLLSGFRDNIGADFGSYVHWYLFKTRDESFELGYLVVMKLFRIFDLSYHFLFFFFSLSTLLFVFLGVKKYTIHSSFAFLFYLLIPALFLGSLNMIRQAFAVAICFYAFHFLITKKYLIYVLLMCVGISIHYTAVVPFIVFFSVYKYVDYIKKIHLAILLFFSLILSQLHWFSIFNPLFVETHYDYYFHTEQFSVNVFKVLVKNSIAVFILYYYDRMKTNYTNQKYYVVLSFLSIVIVNIFDQYVGLIRVSHFFMIFQILFFADVLFLEIKKRRLLLFACLYGYGVSLFINALRVDYQIELKGLNYIPYKSIFYKFDDPFFMMGTDCLVDPSLQKEAK